MPHLSQSDPPSRQSMTKNMPTFVHRYHQHDPRLYHLQSPLPVKNPTLVHLNTPLLSQLGLPQTLDWQTIISGDLTDLSRHSQQQIKPLAMAYAGHQFGQWAGQLGDGRGLLIAELADSDYPSVAELHLKGSGKTPYSRHGDGRAMIDSSVREYLCGHALYHLGVPSSQAIGLVISDTHIHRGTIERAATLLRVSDCHIRLGHIEWVATFAPDYFGRFIDKIILDYFPQFHRTHTGKANDLLGFLQAICTNNAKLIAQWQLIGFSHGVMNTDNLNITGSTLDFGPYGFMEQFDPTWINNASDHAARYCYQNQPTIGHFNLAISLQHFYQLGIKQTELAILLEQYEDAFLAYYHQGLADKLALADLTSSNQQKIAYEFLEILQKYQLDYTNSFRALIAYLTDDQPDDYPHEHQLVQQMQNQLNNQAKLELNQWLFAWKNTICQPKSQAIEQLKRHNPIYVLRNQMAQNAIDTVHCGDFDELTRLFELLKNPYQLQDIAKPSDTQSTPIADNVVVSCLS